MVLSLCVVEQGSPNHRDGQKIPLRASKASTGDSHMGAMVALTLLFGPLGLLKHGNDVKYPAGTKVTVYTDQQVTVKVPQ